MTSQTPEYLSSIRQMLRDAAEHLRNSDMYWHNEDYLPCERAIVTLDEAEHEFVREHVGKLAYAYYCTQAAH